MFEIIVANTHLLQAYGKQYYTDSNQFLLYSGNSIDQVRNFQQAGNTGFYYYNDLFESTTSEHYLTQWPEMTDTKTGAPCYREDDGDASSMAISMLATGEVYVFVSVPQV